MDTADEAQAEQDRHIAASVRSALSRHSHAPSLDCTLCGDPIPEERRAAIPTADLCVDCLERLERGMGR